MLLIFLSYEHFFKEEEKMVTQLLRNHHFIFLLRKPGATKKEYETFIQHIPEEFHHRIMLHDHYELIHNYTVKGLHFSTQNRRYASSYPYVFKSTSCHSLNEIEALDGHFDYMFLSPVFPSISKKGYSGNLDMHKTQLYLSSKRKSKIIALGGIDESKLKDIALWQFDGAALLGALWGDKPPLADYQKQCSKITEATQLFNSQ